MEQWITVVLGRVVDGVVHADEPSSLHRRPVLSGKAGWGSGFFGDRTVTLVGYVVTDSRGARPYQFPGPINLRSGDVLEVQLHDKLPWA